MENAYPGEGSPLPYPQTSMQPGNNAIYPQQQYVPPRNPGGYPGAAYAQQMPVMQQQAQTPSKKRTVLKTLASAFDVMLIVELVIVAMLAAILVLPRPFGLEPYVVQTQSMTPTISAGDIAYIDTTKASTAKAGEVVAFSVGDGQLCMHRAMDVSNGAVQTKGDANDHPAAATIPVTSIRGHYAWKIPNIGIYVAPVLANIPAVVAVIAATALAAYATGKAANKKNEEILTTKQGRKSA